MARKKRDEGGGYSWMDTYGDMVTLLLTFFILLFSMSSVNAEKWEMLVNSFQKKGDETTQIVLIPEGQGSDLTNNGATGKPPNNGENIDTANVLPTSFDQLYEYIKSYVEENEMEGSVSVSKRGDNSVYVRFQDNLLFAPDSANLLPNSRPVLDFMGDCLKSVEEEVLMTRINGHTAKVDNYAVSDRVLSTNRANSVLMYFEDMKDVESKKLMASGYGNNFPIASNDTIEGRRKNRRVDIMILSKNIQTGTTQDLMALLADTMQMDIFNDNQNSEEIIIPTEKPTNTVPINIPENLPKLDGQIQPPKNN